MSDKSIARYDGPRSVDELARYSELMSAASVLPSQFRNNPGSIMFAVEYAKALDVSPVTAITGMHIMDGKPSASANLISALIRRAGHKLTVRISGSVKDLSLSAHAVLVRADDPDAFPYESTWDLGRAERAELLTLRNGKIVSKSKNGNATQWEKYPENMVKSRAITEVARDGAADVLLGVAYTPEELGADVDENGDVVYTVTQVPDAAPRRDNPAPDPTPSPDPDPAAPEDPTALADAARRAIFAARSLDPDLVAVWNGPEIRGKQDRAATLVTADANDVETTVLDLFRAAADAIKAGGYLTAGTRYDDDHDDGNGSGGQDAPPAPNGPSGRDTPDAGIVPDEVANDLTRPPEVAHTDGDHDGNVRPEPDEDGSPMRSALDAVMRELDESDVTAVVAYCRDHNLNPAQGEEACRLIVEAIRTGNALPVSFPVDPEQLLVSILGAEVVQRIPHRTTEELHAAMLANREEDRRDAAASRQATGRGPAGGGLDEYRATRAANQA